MNDAFRETPFRMRSRDMGFTEGPVFLRSGALLVTSIDRGHLYAIDESGCPQLYAVTGGGPNGATEGSDGTIYVCQNGGRGPGWRKPALTGGVQVVTIDGGIDWLSTDPISPNDLCFGPDGYLYVTDPTRGPHTSDGRIWRLDVTTGEADLLTSVPWYPNGIGFGLEDDAVYVVSTRSKEIIRFPLSNAGLGKPETVIRMDHGRPDGFAFDVDGNLIVGVNGDGPAVDADIQIWTSDGKHVESLRPTASARHYTNTALSADGCLVITFPDEGAVLEAKEWPTTGLPLHPFRRANG